MDNKRLIADTYLELLKKKNIDKITIKDIVDGCGITRQSFYYHFCDVFDLIEWIMSEGCKTVLEDTQNAENPQTVIKLLLQMMFDRYDIIMSMLNYIYKIRFCSDTYLRLQYFTLIYFSFMYHNRNLYIK